MSRGRQLLILSLVALAARIMVLGDPVIHVDEEFYLVTARAMWAGAMPYVDVWDRKPIGLFLVYASVAWLPLWWSVWAYQLMALASVVATAGAIVRLADRIGWGRGGLAGGIAYILWLNLLGGVGGQAPVFFNLAMVGAATLTAAGAGRRWFGIGAMTLVGIALQIKYSVVFEGMFLGLWLLWADWRARRSMIGSIGYGGVLVAVAVLPTAVAFGVYAAWGQADAWLFANFTSILGRNADPLGERLGNAGQLVLILSPLVAMAWAAQGAWAGRGASARRGDSDGGDRALRRFAFAWLAAAVAGVAAFGSWFDHYGLPVLVPGALCAAGFFASARQRTTVAILGLVAVIGQVTVLVNRHNRGTGAQVAALADAVGRGPGCLYVYSGNTMLYPATGRCAATRYLFPSHLTRRRESGATGVVQAAEVRRILATRPAVVVMRPPYRGERADIRALASRTMAPDYRLVATRPMGREMLSVYARR